MALEGTLQDMSMSDLFQVFRLGPKSGILLLEYNDERGVIYVDRGRLIDAFVVRGTERSVVATADDAVLYTLAWDDASFVFRHDLSVANRSVQIKHDSEWLVLESMRRRSDPTRALPYHKITMDTQLRLSPLPTNAESSVSLDVDQWRVLSFASNNQDLRTICTATGIPSEKTVRIVVELVSLGLVEAVQPPPKPTKPKWAEQSGAQVASGSAIHQRPGHPSGTMQASSAAATGATPPQQRPIGRGLLDAIMRRVSEL